MLEAVAQRVLDQRLEQERRDERMLRSGRDVHGRRQSIAEAHALDGQVGSRQRDLGVQRGLGLAIAGQRRTQQIAEPGQHPSGRHRIVLRQHRDVLQAVEQEVRLQPHPQRVELGLAQARRQLRLLEHQPRGAALVLASVDQGAQRRGASDRRPVEQLVPEQLARRDQPAQRHRVRRALRCRPRPARPAPPSSATRRRPSAR